MTHELDIDWKEPHRWSLDRPEAGAAQEVRRAVAAAIESARGAQAKWSAVPVGARIAMVKRLRETLAEAAHAAAAKLCGSRPPAEFLAAQLIPFLDACRFVERRGARLLRPRRHLLSPAWLPGVSHEVRREPLGVVLILAPSNYPFFLPAVQVLQALVAGNAALLKPGEGGAKAAYDILGRFMEAGFPSDLIQVLGEEPYFGIEAISLGVDKIFLTGSAETGAKVLAQAAAKLTPSTMELSGCDAVFVLPDADLRLAAECVVYGAKLNESRTCIAPRRVFVWKQAEEEFRRELERASQGSAIWCVDDPDLAGFGESFLAVMPVEDARQAQAEYCKSGFRLGASIFTRNTAEARGFAAALDAGSICINDIIVPTADGRLPFGGRKQSGFGATRGAEGLLEMTTLKVVSRRRGNFRPHLDPKQAEDAPALSCLARLIYGGWQAKWQAALELCRRKRNI